MRKILFLVALACLYGPARAQCGPDGCIAPTYQWKQSASEPDWWGLFAGGVQVGVWQHSTNQYRPIIGGSFCEPRPLPVAAPAAAEKKDRLNEGATVEQDGTVNFGLDREHMPYKRQHVLNGREVSREEMLAAIKPEFADDSAELCLTVIGSEEDRQPVLNDLSTSPLLSSWKGKLKVQGYDPSHWAVKDSGFVTTGHPTIYCQAPDGRVLHRQDDYRGPESLAEALRDADANYRPAKDPDLGKSSLTQRLEAVWKEVQTMPVWVWLIAALAIYLRFFHKEQK